MRESPTSFPVPTLEGGLKRLQKTQRCARPSAIIICTTSCFLPRAAFISHCFPFQVGPWAPRCSASGAASSAGLPATPPAAACWRRGHLCLPARPPSSSCQSYFGKQQLSRAGGLLIVRQTPSSPVRSHAEIRAPRHTLSSASFSCTPPPRPAGMGGNAPSAGRRTDARRVRLSGMPTPRRRRLPRRAEPWVSRRCRAVGIPARGGRPQLGHPPAGTGSGCRREPRAGRQRDNKATPGADLRSCHVTLPLTY